MHPLLKCKTNIRRVFYITPVFICPMLLTFYWINSSRIFKSVVDYNATDYLYDSVPNMTKLATEVTFYTVFTSGCKIPSMDPYNDIVKPFIGKENDTILQDYCGKLPMLTSMTENNDIVLIESSLAAYGVSRKSSFQCCITDILRDKGGADNDEFRYSKQKCVDIHLPYHVLQDYVRIQCFNNHHPIYTDFYAAIQITPNLEKTWDKMANITRKSMMKAKKLQLSVVIFTLDSVSRLNFHRQMKKSSTFIMKTMKGVEMVGYNKLGDNTFPIIVSILAGMSEEEIQASCGGPYDNCPLIWKNFSRNGYRTAYGEDSYIIANFNSLRKGFRQQPTDYYLRPLFSAEYGSVPRTSWNPHDYTCFANRVQAPVLFNWTRDFVLKMKDRLNFGYFHTSGLTHDNVNWAQFVDPMLFDFMHRAFNSGSFNNTIFILMSDHGMRFGPIRETYFGKLEDYLPLLIFTFPEWFRKAHPSILEQLEANAKRLTSSFDIHETLSDILNGEFDVRSEIYPPGHARRGISLFNEIPEWRTCTDAGIPDQFCTCQTMQQGDVDAPKSIAAAKAVVSIVNHITEPKRNVCAEFSLKSLIRVDISQQTEGFGKIQSKKKREDYTVVIVTNPGDAEFEGTVRFLDNSIVEVLQGVNRVNRYNDKSLCITDIPALKKYCTCIEDNNRLLKSQQNL